MIKKKLIKGIYDYKANTTENSRWNIWFEEKNKHTQEAIETINNTRKYQDRSDKALPQS